MNLLLFIAFTFSSLIQISRTQNCLSYPYRAQIVNSEKTNFPLNCADWNLLYSGEGTVEFNANGTDILIGFFSVNKSFEYTFKFNTTHLVTYKKGDFSKTVFGSILINLNPMLSNRFKISLEKHNQTFIFSINGIKVGELTDTNWSTELIQYSLAQYSNSNVVYFRNDPYIENFPGYPYSPKNTSGLWEFFRNDILDYNGLKKIHFRAKGSGLIIGIFSKDAKSSLKFNYAISFESNKNIKLYKDGDLLNPINSISKTIDYDPYFNKFTIIFDELNSKISVLINGTNQIDFKLNENLTNLGKLYYSYSQINMNVVIDYFPDCKRSLPYNPQGGILDGKDWECFNSDWTIEKGDIRELNFFVSNYDFYIGIFDDNRIHTKFYNYWFVVGGFENTNTIIRGDNGNVVVIKPTVIQPAENFHRIKIQFDLNLKLIKLFINGTQLFSEIIKDGFSFDKNTTLYYSLSQFKTGCVFDNLPVKALPTNFPYFPKLFYANPIKEFEYFNDKWTLPNTGSGQINFSAKGYDIYFALFSEDKIFTTNFDIKFIICGWRNTRIRMFMNARYDLFEEVMYGIEDPSIYNDFRFDFNQNSSTITLYINKNFIKNFTVANWPNDIKYFSFSQYTNISSLQNISSSKI